MRIDIPEFNGRKETPEFLIDMLLGQLNITVTALSQGHNLTSLSDGTGMFLNMGKRFLNISDSFDTIVKRGKDIISAYSLIRIMADYLSTMYLIFGTKDENECLFRYILYHRDGFVKRQKELGYDITNDGRLSQQQFNQLIEQMKAAKENAAQGISECDKLLANHPYKKINQLLFDKLVARNQWKYKKFDVHTTSIEYYKWEDMYSLIDERNSIQSFISYLSQYVRGLSNSLILTCTSDDLYSIQCFGMDLLDKYRSLLEYVYGPDVIKKLMSVEIYSNIEKYFPYILDTIKRYNKCHD